MIFTLNVGAMRAFFQGLATKSKRIIAKKLRSKRGFRGRLKRKRRPDGAPLGGSLPSQVMAARSVSQPEGFDTRYEGIELTVFHSGRAGQAPRPIIGLTQKDQASLAKLVGEAIAKAGKKAGVFKK